MLSLYRAWLGPGPCVSRPAPPPGAHRPVPRRARAPSPPPAPSPSSTTSSELDVEHVEPDPPKQQSTVLDIASCDGPVKFSRVLNTAWRDRVASPDPSWCRRKQSRPSNIQYYPCKTCGSKFPSYYFVHKHRKSCHGEEDPNQGLPMRCETSVEDSPSTSVSA